MVTLVQVGKNSGHGTRGSRKSTLLGTFYTSQYSILVLGASANSLVWPIHFFSPHSISHDVYTN